MNKELAALMPASDTLGILGLMIVAEEEIAQGMEQHPEHKDAIWAMFSNLQPTRYLLRYPVLYRSHCRYLITRVAQGKEIKSPTPAEYCCIFSELSMQAPMQSDLMFAYWKCFKVALPDEAEKMRQEDGDLDYLRESYPGVVAEILTGMKRKLRS